jgi:DNA-binding MarR family transcriptional regulator
MAYTEAMTEAKTGPRWLDETEMRAWVGLLRMSWLIEIGIGRDLTEAGLSFADYHVLASLSEARGHQMRITDLAARISWSKSRLSHQLSRMEARGLVSRSTCPTDARGALALLTPAGLEAIQNAAPGHVESIRRHLLQPLSPEQVGALADIAEAVLSGCAGKEAACAEAGDEDGGCPGEVAGFDHSGDAGRPMTVRPTGAPT